MRYSKHVGVLDLIFPKKCIGCGKMGGYVCGECSVGLWEEEQICPGCHRNSRYGVRHVYCKDLYGLDGLTCLWAYEGIAKKIIKKAKYKYYFDVLEFLILNFNPVALREQFEINVPMTKFIEFLNTKPVVVPVPLHLVRERERGFNQAEVIGNLVARYWMLDTRSLLIRTKDIGHQVGRTRQERLKSVAGVFSLKSNIYHLKSVLLVDDVWTTGATLSECCKILKQNGAKTVWGLVLAR